jgi:nucleoside-diphosphate-sugar epimerase
MNIHHEDIQIVAACRDDSKLPPHYSGEVRVGDLRDPDYLDRVLVGIDIICHTAGWSSFEKSGDTCNKTYLEPTLDLINHAIEWRIKRFINLSSLYAAKPNQRNNADSIGKPRAYWPMINCLIAVEDYLRTYTNSRTQFVNLRLGIYSGKRINMGLLPLLLARSGHNSMPYLTGALGHLPLIDGKDIGQAFVRAALGPIEASFSCFNICGPETPSHLDAMQFIKQQIQHSPLSYGLPSPLANFILWSQSKFQRFEQQALLTSAMLDMLKSPLISNQQARQSLGFDPEVSWKASLLDTLEAYKNQSLNTDLSQPSNNLNLN